MNGYVGNFKFKKIFLFSLANLKFEIFFKYLGYLDILDSIYEYAIG